MERTVKQTAIKLSKEAAFILLTVVCAVALPQLFHGAGVLLGIGGQLGQIFLPMYLPVMIIGFYRGWIPGAIAGLLAPLFSFWMTQMPSAALLPYITVELIATGIFAGLLANARYPAILRVLSVQALAKAVRLVSFMIVNCLINGNALTATALFAGITQSIPGLALQLIIVTALLMVKRKENHD